MDKCQWLALQNTTLPPQFPSGTVECIEEGVKVTHWENVKDPKRSIKTFLLCKVHYELWTSPMEIWERILYNAGWHEPSGEHRFPKEWVKN